MIFLGGYLVFLLGDKWGIIIVYKNSIIKVNRNFFSLLNENDFFFIK